MICFFKNRRGQLGDQISVIYFIVLFVIIGLGLFWGTYSFFGNGYDLREIQSKWLSDDIQKCLLSNSLDFTNKKEFFKVCNLNENILNENGFIIRLCKGNCYISKEEPLFSVNSNYQLCGFGELTSKNSPKCSEKNFTLKNQEVHLIVGSKISPKRLD
jgi:hypothetical protein